MSSPGSIDPTTLAAAGIDASYTDVWGHPHRASDAALGALLRAFGDDKLDRGATDGGDDEAKPDGDRSPDPARPPSANRCHLPRFLAEGARLWGLSVQLYALTTEDTWGIGDFSALRRLVERVADEGGDLVGLNPLHALFGANPGHDSPYSPSSREHLNPIYIDVEALPEFAECEAARRLRASPGFVEQLAALRAAPLVDHAATWSLKRTVLALLHRHFRTRHEPEGGALADAFRRFVEDRGESLARFATFEALDARLRPATSPGHGWRSWPAAFHDPTSEAVRDFVRHEGEDAFHFTLWLQWHADRQLAAVAAHARRCGMRVGLYLDLAVGVDAGGADAWSYRDLLAESVSIGAPPDELQRDGQDWGLPPFVPGRLAAHGFTPLVRALAAGMRHAGALRIDHVMAFHRLYCIPAGYPARDGAYVRYPLAHMMDALAAESERHRCVVVGEDLGTVPPEVTAAMARYGVLHYRPLLFARAADGSFLPPADYPRAALVAATTHDLPTLAGFWSGHDLAQRAGLGLFDDASVRETLVATRAQDRTRLLFALRRERLLPGEIEHGGPATTGAAGANDGPSELAQPATLSGDFAAAVHAFLARTPSMLLMIQPEDLLGVVEQANIPGSLSPAHPNWQRRLPREVDAWFVDERARATLDLVRRERPRAARRAPGDASIRIPRATYRLQFNGGFTFRDALRIVPYLAHLGVSHVYASPFLKARPGSLHGYDIVDHGAINPEIGTRADLEALSDALREHDMGLVADIVPNHMGVTGSDNAWWLDVLEHGESAVHAPFFDIDWQPAKPELAGKVLLAILGAPYGDVLARGELRLDFDRGAGGFFVAYHQHRMPIDPRTFAPLLEAMRIPLSAESDEGVELDGLARLLANLPRAYPADATAVMAAHREAVLYKRRLARLVDASRPVAAALDAALSRWNGAPGDEASFDRLHALLEQQHYRLADWHAASDEINYRRFFDVNELAAVRMEDARVFEATHALVFELCADGVVEGLRVDHPDGLHDPEAYFRMLQRRVAEARGAEPDAEGRATWLVVEKILAPHETLPAGWAVHGTTGYDFMTLVNGLFLDGRAALPLERFHAAFTGRRAPFDEELHAAKRLVMKRALASELTVLANRLNRISESDRRTRDFTLNRLRQALAEVVAWFPVYRTYIRETGLEEGDRRHIDHALGRARRSAGDATAGTDAALYDFLERALTVDLAGGDARENLRFAMRFQQFTAPVTAKSFEDTALYRHIPLVSVNEVGGDPRSFGTTPEAFHRANAMRARRWPHAMLATSTHDNKRGEDVRARLDVLSEIPGEWMGCVRRWSRMARSRRTRIEGTDAPSRTDEYLFFQTLVGVWPVSRAGAGPADEEGADADEGAHAARVERVAAYMRKAAREAKLRTSWTAPDAAYEAALDAFVRRMLANDARNLFLADVRRFVRAIAGAGAVNGLAQTLLKLTAPGVPDLYQGTETLDDSLVDPDNRRPVAFEALAARLAEVDAIADASSVRAVFADPSDPRAKLLVVHRTLRARARDPDLFTHGEYLPLRTSGRFAERVCAFARRLDDRWAVVVVPRLTAPDRITGRASDWADTRVILPDGGPPTLVDRLVAPDDPGVVDARDGSLDPSRLFAVCPVALLLAGSPPV